MSTAGLMPPRSDQRWRQPALGTALRATFSRGYDAHRAWIDIRAGLIVAATAIPTSLALALASGLTPWHGLWTAAVAGLIAPLLGGSQTSLTGPTAAFAVVVAPLVSTVGWPVILIATALAGLLLIAAGLLRLSWLIAYVPYPVLVGYGTGIAFIVAATQLPTLLGLQATTAAVLRPLHADFDLLSINPAATLIGLASLAALIAGRILHSRMPPALVVSALGAGAAFLMRHLDDVPQIPTLGDAFGERLGYDPNSGIVANILQGLEPLTQAGLSTLIVPTVTIALLAAIQSLRAAAAASRRTGTGIDGDAELVAQGLGNLVTPFFGGLPAAAGYPATLANIAAGAASPIAAAVQALAVLTAALLLGTVLRWLPTPTLAAMMLMLAWNLGDGAKFFRILTITPRADAVVLMLSFIGTIAFGPVQGILGGTVLAALLLVRRMSITAQISGTDHPLGLPAGVRHHVLSGPLFYANAERMLAELPAPEPGVRAVILDLANVLSIDLSGLIVLERTIDNLNRAGVFVAICCAQSQALRALRDAGYLKQEGRLWYYSSVPAALRRLREMPAGPPARH